MTDILPAYTGARVDAIFGKGSVALITDEILAAMSPTRVNGVDGTIRILLHHSQGCAEVHDRMPGNRQVELLEELEQESPPFMYLTMPMVHRPAAESWAAAADVLEALARAARIEANAARKQKPAKTRTKQAAPATR